MHLSAEKRRPLLPFLTYLVGFFGIWTAWVLLAYPRIIRLGDRTLIYALVNIACRLALWVIPVFAYLRYIDKVNVIDYLKLRQHWKRGVLVGTGFSVLNLLGTIARAGAPHPSMHSVTWNSILSTSILVGFVEEIPFRGFILQKLEERCGFWMANLTSSLLFLGIHFPGWISLHMLTPALTLSIFVLGVVFALLFHYSKSLWSAIVAHSLNDFISAVIFHI